MCKTINPINTLENLNFDGVRAESSRQVWFEYKGDADLSIIIV